MSMVLTTEQYEALVVFSRRGATTPDQMRDLEVLLASADRENHITRSKLWVQWQETDSPVPPNVEFPQTWPPVWRAYVELTTRPIARSDIDELLKRRARRPVQVLVTSDPGAVLGWTPIENFFPP